MRRHLVPCLLALSLCTQGSAQFLSGTRPLDPAPAWVFAEIGDLDGDGANELAVGLPDDDAGGLDSGAVRILFLGPDGAVRSSQRISAVEGGFTGALGSGVAFGSALADVGDLDGDGLHELAVGAPGAPPGQDAVFVLFLRSNGTVRANTRIADFDASLFAYGFGSGLAPVGDLNGDGLPELAIAKLFPPELDVALLAPDGSVAAWADAWDPPPGCACELEALAAVGDTDGNGAGDLLLVYAQDVLTGSPSWWLHLVRLTPNGTFLSEKRVPLAGSASRFLFDAGDVDGDAIHEVVVGELGPESVYRVGPPAQALARVDSFLPLQFGGVRVQDRNGDGCDDFVLGQGSGLELGFRNCSGCAGSIETIVLPRNAAPNPPIFQAVAGSPPVVGGTWRTSVDLASVGALGSLLVVATGGPLPGVRLGAPFQGTLLVRPPFLSPVFVSASDLHEIPIPVDCSHVGQIYWAQAAAWTGSRLVLTNALDLRVGTF